MGIWILTESGLYCIHSFIKEPVIGPSSTLKGKDINGCIITLKVYSEDHADERKRLMDNDLNKIITAIEKGHSHTVISLYEEPGGDRQ
ncbi:MAG: hypothetical protein WCW02_02370 [Candidatus Buchananbacteria bacterium]